MTMTTEQTIKDHSTQDEEFLVLTHPDSLIKGEQYIYRDVYSIDNPEISIVKFVAYTSCPAVVVVSNGAGQRVHCSRERLYLLQTRINGWAMNPVRVNDLTEVQTLAELVELCRIAGAVGSTVISSCDKVIVYYKDPLTSDVMDPDFVDELHIRHPMNARLLIAVFPGDDG